MDMAKQESLTDVVDKLIAKAEDADGDDVSIQSVLDAFAGRLFGPLLLVPGLVILTPLGGIPTVPTLIGAVVVLVAGQAIVGRTHPWLPRFIADRSVSQQKFISAMNKFKPWARWIDRLTRPRLEYLVTGRMKYGIAAICVLVALTMPPLELLPFAAIAPGAAITLLGLAITSHDGLVGLMGLMAAATTVGLVTWTLL
jgi:hypothetical protein